MSSKRAGKQRAVPADDEAELDAGAKINSPPAPLDTHAIDATQHRPSGRARSADAKDVAARVGGLSVMRVDLEQATSTEFDAHEAQSRAGLNRQAQNDAHDHQVAASRAAALKRKAEAMSEQERKQKDAGRKQKSRAEDAAKRSEAAAARVPTSFYEYVGEMDCLPPIEHVPPPPPPPPLPAKEDIVWFQSNQSGSWSLDKWKGVKEAINLGFVTEGHHMPFKGDAAGATIYLADTFSSADKWDDERKDAWFREQRCMTQDEWFQEQRCMPGAPPPDPDPDDDPYGDYGADNFYDGVEDDSPPCKSPATASIVNVQLNRRKDIHGLWRVGVTLNVMSDDAYYSDDRWDMFYRQCEREAEARNRGVHWSWMDGAHPGDQRHRTSEQQLSAADERDPGEHELRRERERAAGPPPRRNMSKYGARGDAAGDEVFRKDREMWYEQFTGRSIDGVSLQEQNELCDVIARRFREYTDSEHPRYTDRKT